MGDVNVDVSSGYDALDIKQCKNCRTKPFLILLLAGAYPKNGINLILPVSGYLKGKARSILNNMNPALSYAVNC